MESIINKALMDDSGRKVSVSTPYVGVLENSQKSNNRLAPPAPPQAPTPDFWLIMRALFNEGHPAGELPAALVLWSESNHKAAFDHLWKSLDNPAVVRATLGGIYRKMDMDTSPGGRAILDEARRNDPASYGFLTPYIAKDEAGIAEINSWDATWRGVRDDLDRAAVETWYASMEANP